MGRIVITGATGFVGRALVDALAPAMELTLAVRRPLARVAANCRIIEVGDIGGDTDWRPALADAEAVVHLAARVHVMADRSPDPLAAYRLVNRDGTLALANAAAQAGVKRIVFLSTVKVLGEATREVPFSDANPPCPQDAYAISKREAELGLQRLAAVHPGLEFTVLRPPLVYGPGVGGNFRTLIAIVRRGWPLPLASIDNRRSLLFLGNLVDAVGTLLKAPVRPGYREFLLCDGEDVSTSELIRRLALALGRRPRLFGFPAGWLSILSAGAGQGAAFRRLTDSLHVDDRAFRQAYGWTPPYTLDAGLAATLERAPAL